MPHEPIEAQLLLEKASGGPPRTARLIWSTVARDDPQQVSVSFDGEPLEVEDPERIEEALRTGRDVVEKLTREAVG